MLSGYGQLLMLLDRFDESRELCEQAIDIAIRVGARQAEGHARNTLGLDLVAQGHVDDGLVEFDRSLEIAYAEANVDDIGRGYVNLVRGCCSAAIPSGPPRKPRTGCATPKRTGSRAPTAPSSATTRS